MCDLNDEQDALERAFGDRAFSVRGPMSPDDKEAAIRGWLAGDRPIMISKPWIMGGGINAQHCARMAFVGVTDSFEAYYQALRRCWRFGPARVCPLHPSYPPDHLPPSFP
ncbi:helicase C-terminal domain-containing protein, partial [Leclercia adecarboxylata]|uniref:helicase C-terminal domain-containing protein n=1 Tax=Leclercia adecarboxylata TaxID=83655 RepID=UPI0036F3A370